MFLLGFGRQCSGVRFFPETRRLKPETTFRPARGINRDRESEASEVAHLKLKNF